MLDGGHQEGREHIKGRVLLDEHGRQDNGNAKDQRSYADPFVFGKRFAVHHRQMGAQGVIDMDAGEKVGGRVRLPEQPDEAGKHIVPWKFFQPKVLDVGTEGGNHQENRHAGTQKDRVVPVSFPVPEKQINQDRRDIKKPQQVRQGKTQDFAALSTLDLMLLLAPRSNRT